MQTYSTNVNIAKLRLLTTVWIINPRMCSENVKCWVWYQLAGGNQKVLQTNVMKNSIIDVTVYMYRSTTAPNENKNKQQLQDLNSSQQLECIRYNICKKKPFWKLKNMSHYVCWMLDVWMEKIYLSEPQTGLEPATF